MPPDFAPRSVIPEVRAQPVPIQFHNISCMPLAKTEWGWGLPFLNLSK